MDDSPATSNLCVRTTTLYVLTYVHKISSCSSLVVEKITHRTNSWQIKNCANDRYSSEEIDSHWKEATEQNNEPVGFNDHANERIAQQNHDYSSEKGRRAFDFVILKEESKCPFQPNDKSQPTEKQDLERRELNNETQNAYDLKRILYQLDDVL